MEWVSLAIGGWLLLSVAAAVVIGVAICRAERRSQDSTTDSWEAELAHRGRVPPAVDFPAPRSPQQAAPERQPTSPAADSR